MILLDTSVLSRAFRRTRPGPAETGIRSALTQLLRGEASLGLPGIVLQEVLSGIRSERQSTDLRRRLVGGFAVVHPTTDDHVEAARLKNACLARGLNVSGTDCLIATLAITGNHQLYTVDGDFRLIAKHAPLQLFSIG